MKKFNYTDWVTKNKHGETLKENFTPDLEDDERKRKLIQQMIAKEKEARKKEITGMEDVNEEPNEISYDDAKEKGLENPDKADISKDKDISDYELARGMAIQKAIDQVKNEMKVTDKDGNDVTSDIIKDMEKSLKDAGYEIEPSYSSDANIRPGYKARPTKAEGEEEDLTFEPEGMDNPDEDLVVIGSGYLDIENKFGERPSMTNGEYAALGQKVVDGNSELQKDGEMPKFDNKEAALKHIYDEINEVDDGKEGQQEPSEDDQENQSQDDIAMGADDAKDFAFSLQELAEALGYLNEEENYQNLPKPDKINLSYTDPGFRFYKMSLYKDGKRFAKISYKDRATKYLKNLGVSTEIPKSFDTDKLDDLINGIEALGIKGDYDAAFDPS